jgi:hypothetical protein
MYLTMYYYWQEEEIRRLIAKIRHSESEEGVLVERLQVVAAL